MPQSILVTGAAGFIGSHLVERLLARGDRVIGVDNFDPFYDPAEKHANLEAALLSERFRLVRADCAAGAVLERELAGEDFSAVVHLAAKAGVRPSVVDPVSFAHANLIGTQTMLELARSRDVSRFILASSSSVYGNNRKVPFSENDPVEQPISPYAATKRAAELLAYTYHHLYGMNVLALRFFTVYGPRQRPDLAIRKFTELLLRGRPVPMYGDGNARRDYTWIDDIIDGVVAAVDRTALVAPEYETINLGGSRTTSLRRLIYLIGDALGVATRIEQLPAQPGDVDCTYADVHKAARLLDYAPRTPIDKGIPRFVAWARARATPAAPRPSAHDRPREHASFFVPA